MESGSMKRLWKLLRHPLFAGFQMLELQHMIRTLGIEYGEYNAGEVVLVQGRPRFSVGCLVEGEIEVSICQEVNRGNRRMVIAWMKAPAVFGEALAFAGRGTQIEIRARRKSQIYFIPGEAVMNHYEDPKTAILAARLLEQMWKKIGILEQKLLCLQGQEVKTRLWYFLEGLPCDETGCFTIPYADKDVAAFLGYTRTALHGAYRELEEEGAIELVHRRGRLQKKPEKEPKPVQEILPEVGQMLSGIDRMRIRELTRQKPEPARTREILKMLCRVSIAIEAMNLQIMLQQNESARVKTLKFLMNAKKNPDGTLAEPVTVTELAKKLGMNRQTLSTELADLAKHGIIERKTNMDSLIVRLPGHLLLEEIIGEVRGPAARELSKTSQETEFTEKTGGKKMIETTKTMREIVKADPKFGDFLREKGFPFTTRNPITAFVTFEDVVKRKKLDKEAFLKEYDGWREKH